MLPYDEAGDGPATLVLLHAGVADRRMWAGHLDALAAAGQRVIAPDLPGFGDAEATAGEDAVWLRVLATLDGVGVDRAALVGNSYGGAIAQRLVVEAPQRFTALGLVSSPSPDMEASPGTLAAWDAEEQAVEEGDIEAAVAAVVDAWTGPAASGEVRALVADMQRRAYAMLDGPPPADDDPLGYEMSALGAFTGPALVVVGGEEREDFTRAAQSLAAVLPHAGLVTLDGVAHLAPLEAPERFRALVLGLLAAE